MTLYLIDGHSYVYRAYHAIKNLSNSRGLPTNAIYGFTTMMLKIIKEKKPDALCIVFDSAAPTERHKLYEKYKAQRPETPPDLLTQIPAIKKIIEAFNISTVELPGYEADDIICTIARKAAMQGCEVFIVSGDKDMMQALDTQIKIYDPMKDSVVDKEYVKKRYGVPPERISEFMAITGDVVDNIPGVKGIGEKTARDLLTAADSLDELLNNPERIENERLRKMIMANLDTIKLSKTLATIDTHLPIELNTNEFMLKKPDWSALLHLFSEFEFKTLLRLIPADGYQQRGHYETITDREKLVEFFKKPL
ncbi:MAG: 5'-3' exonuclease H3TH domain-containing protein [Dissulfurispiraceae bacterium]